VKELESLITHDALDSSSLTPESDGGVLPRSDLEAIARLAIKHNVPVLTDECISISSMKASSTAWPLSGMADCDFLTAIPRPCHDRLAAGYGIMPHDLAST